MSTSSKTGFSITAAAVVGAGLGVLEEAQAGITLLDLGGQDTFVDADQAEMTIALDQATFYFYVYDGSNYAEQNYGNYVVYNTMRIEGFSGIGALATYDNEEGLRIVQQLDAGDSLLGAFPDDYSSQGDFTVLNVDGGYFFNQTPSPWNDGEVGVFGFRYLDPTTYSMTYGLAAARIGSIEVLGIALVDEPDDGGNVQAFLDAIAPSSVPTPPSLALLAAGAAGAGLLRRRKAKSAR